MKFFKENLLTFAAKLVVMGFGVLQMVILTRGLDTSQFGFFIYLTLIPGMIFQILNLGMDQTILYFAGRKVYSDETVATNALAYGVAVGVGAGLLLMLASWLLPLHEIQSHIWLMVMAGLLVPLFFITYGMSAFLIAKGRVAQYNLVNLSNYGLVLLLLFVFLILLRARQNGLFFAFLATCLGMGCTTALILILIRKSIDFTRLDKVFFIHFLRFGFTAYLAMVLSQLIYRVDILIIGVMLDSSAVAFYAISVRLAEKLWMLSSMFQVTLLPKLAGAESREKELEYTSRVCRNVLLLSMAGAPLLALVSWAAIPILFGEIYLRAVVPLLLLLPGVVGLSLNKVLAVDFLSRGKPIYATVITGAVLVLNLALNFLLIPRYNIEGAALASSVSYLIGVVCFLWVAVVRFGFELKELLVVQRSDLEYYKAFIRSVRNRFG